VAAAAEAAVGGKVVAAAGVACGDMVAVAAGMACGDVVAAAAGLAAAKSGGGLGALIPPVSASAYLFPIWNWHDHG
jgi:hypothetical protein